MLNLRRQLKFLDENIMRSYYTKTPKQKANKDWVTTRNVVNIIQVLENHTNHRDTDTRTALSKHIHPNV